MTISVIKGSDNVNYNLRDDVHTGGGRNLLGGTSWVNSFTGNNGVTGGYNLTAFDTLSTSIKRGSCNGVKRTRSGTTGTSGSEFCYYCRNGTTLIPGEVYTLSGWQYAPTDTWYASYGTNYLTSNIRYYDSSGTKIADSTTMNPNNTVFKPTAVATGEYRTSTFTVPAAAAGHVWGYIYFSIPRDIDLILCQFKLEHGNKATDWSPAPEDIAHVKGECLELLS